MSLKTELDKLALSLIKATQAEDVALEDRVDVFKAVSAYHIGTQRIIKGKPSDDEGGVSFNAILKKVNGSADKGTRQ